MKAGLNKLRALPVTGGPIQALREERLLARWARPEKSQEKEDDHEIDFWAD